MWAFLWHPWHWNPVKKSLFKCFWVFINPAFFLAFWQKLDLPKMQETRFFQKTRFEICQKLDFSRNFVKIGGHFGTKHQYFHLRLTNLSYKRGKLDFKKEKTGL